jgi:general secretion pathway protein A
VYERFYGLRKGPFNTTPDPEFLFLTRTHREALAAVTYGVERRKGFVVITGETGVGKTTVLRSCLARMDPERVEVIYVLNPNVTFRELMRTICRELDLTVGHDDPCELVNALHNRLIEAHRRSKNVILVIDEAQNMPVATLEELRLLSNLETTTQKFLQIVLVGQPELDRKLSRVELRQLKQRIVIRALVVPFSRRESRAYIEHRLRKAGGAIAAEVFSPAAVREIVRAANGIPRLLNILADNALISGFGADSKPVSVRIVREVVRDSEGQRRRALPVGRWLAVGAALAAAAAFSVLQPRTFVGSRGGMEAANLTRAGGLTRTPALPGERANEPAAAPAHTGASAAESGRPAEAAQLSPAGSGAADADREQRQPSRDVLTTWTVRPGDTLSGLAVQVYGFTSDRLLAAIQRFNSDIADVHSIAPGTRVRFPRAPNI